MNSNQKATLGAILIGSGIVAALVAIRYVGAWLLWSAMGAAIAGFILIVLAIREAVHQIADSRVRHDTMLRAQHSMKSREEPPRES